MAIVWSCHVSGFGCQTPIGLSLLEVLGSCTTSASKLLVSVRAMEALFVPH